MTTDKAQRKERPIARGVLDYFPDAIAEIAHVSFVGNQQHNPGQEMHWAKDKSPDHADCILRHLIERGTLDTDGLRHSAKAAWRALALLQIELDAASQPAETGIQEYVERVTINQVEFFRPSGEYRQQADYNMLTEMGCPPKVAAQIVGGTSYATIPPNERSRYIYIAGPMRGFVKFNFPAFDAARDAFLAKGFHVISPADIDRSDNKNADDTTQDVSDQTRFVLRDFWANFFIKKIDQGQNGIALLDGWQKSTGATGEFFLDRWLGLKTYKPDGTAYDADAAKHDYALAHSVMKIFTPEVSPTPKPKSDLNGDWDASVPHASLNRGIGYFFRVKDGEVSTVSYTVAGMVRPCSQDSLPFDQAVANIEAGQWTRLTDDTEAYAISPNRAR